MPKITYPKTKKTDFVEILHGHTIPDPFNLLDNPDGPETKQFVEDQNNLTSSILKSSSIQSKFKETLTGLMDYPKFGTPEKEGDYFYYFYNSGLQAQSVLMQQSSLDSEAKVFFDPNKLSSDGTISINGYSFSKSGKYFAYALSNSGSDWVKIHVQDVKTKEVIEDPLEWAKFTSIEWSHDDKGFFYNAYDPPAIDAEKAGTETTSNKFQKVKYHKLGTNQSEDHLVYQDSDPDCLCSLTVSDDGKYLILGITASCDPNNKVYIASFDEYLKNLPEPPRFVKIVDSFEFSSRYITNEGDTFYFLSTLNASKKRLVKYSLGNPESVIIGL
jgi:prolyl oligopeptidase